LPAVRRPLVPTLWLASLLGLAFARPAFAVLDVENRGPTLSAGAFAMRVTNNRQRGQPVLRAGPVVRTRRSSTARQRQRRLEARRPVGGARVPSLGAYRVSGGPLLEWRPTLEADDRVRTAFGGQFGRSRSWTTTGTGRSTKRCSTGATTTATASATRTWGSRRRRSCTPSTWDDRPEAVAYGYAGGEAHVPLHLDVKQEAFTWSIPGYDRIAGVRFTVTNHGVETLEEVRLGLLADLDSRGPGEAGGHLNDRIGTERYEVLYNDGVSTSRASTSPASRTCRCGSTTRRTAWGR